MQSMDLGELLRKPEGKTLELKRDLSSPEGVLKTVVAFANTAGGVILIGVEDGTRRVVGVEDPLALEERLANLITDNVRPFLLPELDVLPWRSTHLLAAQVYPSSVRPHYLKRLGTDGGVFVRVGSTNRRADVQLIEELRRFARHELFDEQAMPQLGPEAIDVTAATQAFAGTRILAPTDLHTLRILTTHQGREVPTVGGVLLFGTDRASHFPDAWIQAGRFAGADRRRLLDSAELRNLPVRAVDDVIGFVRRNIAREAVIGAVRRTDRWAFPLPAVREAVINAVVHADYAQRGGPIRIAIFDDRLEIENPGLLPFGLTIDEIRRGVSRLRNRVIGRVFHELGLIEQWGSGIQRMTAACVDAGLDEPEFEELGMRFRATLSGVRRRAPALNETDEAIVSLLADGAGLSTRQVADAIGRSSRATRSRLASLVERGVVVEVGSGPNDPRRRYFSAERATSRPPI